MRSLVCTSPRTSLSPAGMTTTVRRPGISRTSVPPTASVRFNKSMIGDAMASLKRCPRGAALGKTVRGRVDLRLSWALARRSRTRSPFRARASERALSRSAVNVNHRPALFVHHAVPVGGDARVRPFEEPSGIGRREIHAAVAARFAEIIVPIRAVQGEPFVEILHERYISQVEGVTAVLVTVHGGADFFLIDHERATHGRALVFELLFVGRREHVR